MPKTLLCGRVEELKKLRIGDRPSSSRADADAAMALSAESVDLTVACCPVSRGHRLGVPDAGASKHDVRRLGTVDLLVGRVVDRKTKRLLIDNEDPVDVGC